MTTNEWILLGVGVLIGWLTKAPFLINYYKRLKKDKEAIERIAEYVKNKSNVKDEAPLS